MKKRLFSLLLALLLLTLLLPAAFAEESTQEIIVLPAEETPAPAEETPAPEFPYVLDNAGLLRDSQRETLEQKAAALSEQHACALYIVTVEDFTVYNSDVYEAADGIFHYYDLGLGEERNGVILLLSMKERDYAFAGHGNLGETICGYESSWIIEDTFLDNFRRNDWNGGFSDYLDACGIQLTRLENGEDITQGADIIQGSDGLEYHSYNAPSSENSAGSNGQTSHSSSSPSSENSAGSNGQTQHSYNTSSSGSNGRGYGTHRRVGPFAWFLRVVLIPCLIAFAVCSGFKAKMKTAYVAVNADRYLVPHSVKLRVRQDRFTHRTETRTLIQSDSGSSGSGSSGSSRSSGHSGGGSSFHSGGGSSGRSGKF